MGYDKKLCLICAWRETCVKKFRFSDGVALNCIDFTRDVTLKQEKGDEDRRVEKGSTKT